MEISTLLLLLPGLVALGITSTFTGSASRPINEILVDLVLYSVFVFLIYLGLSFFELFDFKSPIYLATELAKLKSHPELDYSEFIKAGHKAVVCSLILAILVGLSSAFCKEKKVVQKIGKLLGGIFHGSALETSWKTAFDQASFDSWVQIDTKDNRRFIGFAKAVSWERKDGGLGLETVYLWNGATEEFERTAEYAYIAAEDISGPIFFIKA